MIVFDASAQMWTATWGRMEWSVRLEGGQLLAHYLGPREAQFFSPQSLPYLQPPVYARGECAVYTGDHDELVAWSLADWTAEDTHLRISLQTPGLLAHLEYEILPDLDLIVRRTRLTNRGAPVRVRRANSFALALPPDGAYTLLHLDGSWGHECGVVLTPVGQHEVLLQSLAGKTGYEHAPWFAIEGNGDGTGGVWIGALLWSGNWEIRCRQQPRQPTAVMGGLHPFALRQALGPGAALDLPGAVYGYVSGDLNVAVQRLHVYQRRRRPDPDRPIPVQFNSWYPYPGEPDARHVDEMIDDAARLGCEVFVLDAGWFTTEVERPGDDWMTRVGDWVLNRRLFPDGLTPLVERCHTRGLQFGIWLEPEAAGPSSWVVRHHPEWCHVSPDARKTINLGIPDARRWVRERIFAVLRDTGAGWLKWDFNIDVLPGGPPLADGTDAIVAHTIGLYTLMDEVRAAFPQLILEMCAGGGGRFDDEIIARSHTNWMSDQVNPVKNLAIHFGSHLAHCAVQCNDWLICWPPDHDYGHRETYPMPGDLAFRTRVAMLGSFGISAAVREWTPEDSAVVADHVALYRRHIRSLVHHGAQYRLTEQPPFDGQGDWAALWYVAHDGAAGVLFAFRLGQGTPERRFALPGLDAGRAYEVQVPGGEAVRTQGTELGEGVMVTCPAPFTSQLVLVRARP